MSGDLVGLPSAQIEEVFHPEHVVAIRDDDGTAHLLFYGGQTQRGYLFVKHIVVGPDHAELFARLKPPAPTLPPALALAVPEPEVQTELIRPSAESEGTRLLELVRDAE